MCGRYTLHSPKRLIVEHFKLNNRITIEPRYNIAPSQEVPVIRPAGEGNRELVKLRWGLIPFWAEEPKTGYSMINARAETVAKKPAFRAAFRKRRCLVPADGFYEWKTSARGKQPHHIRMRDHSIFAFAGLWEHWEDEDGQMIESCTIIVTDANELLRPIHDRMPVILDQEQYSSWLDVENVNAQRAQELLIPYPGDRLQAYPVSTRVNSPTHDDDGCITPLDE